MCLLKSTRKQNLKVTSKMLKLETMLKAMTRLDSMERSREVGIAKKCEASESQENPTTQKRLAAGRRIKLIELLLLLLLLDSLESLSTDS